MENFDFYGWLINEKAAKKEAADRESDPVHTMTTIKDQDDFFSWLTGVKTR